MNLSAISDDKERRVKVSKCQKNVKSETEQEKYGEVCGSEVWK